MQSIYRNIVRAGLAGLLLTGSIGLISGGSALPLCPADAEELVGRYLGSSSCGGGSCHGSSSPVEGRPANEYTIWTSKDRHSKAYETLFSTQASSISAELGGAASSDDARCLRCHTTVGAFNVPKKLQGSGFHKDEGVNCDACHGPAEGWIEAHSRPHKYEDMLKLGMRDSRNLWSRADGCVHCHALIDPELVFAGHPDLSFELVSHSRRLPPHWLERQSWDAVRAWSVGTGVALREVLVQFAAQIKNEKDRNTIDLTLAQVFTYLAVFRHIVDTYGSRGERALVAELNKRLDRVSQYDSRLQAACVNAAKVIDTMARRLAKETPFSKINVALLWAKITKDRMLLVKIDEFTAQQVAGALIALYSSFNLGEGPRLTTELEIPAELSALLLRPNLALPEDLFDGEPGRYTSEPFERGRFNSKKWLARLARVVELYSPVIPQQELDALLDKDREIPEAEPEEGRTEAQKGGAGIVVAGPGGAQSEAEQAATPLNRERVSVEAIPISTVPPLNSEKPKASASISSPTYNRAGGTGRSQRMASSARKAQGASRPAASVTLNEGFTTRGVVIIALIGCLVGAILTAALIFGASLAFSSKERRPRA